MQKISWRLGSRPSRIEPSATLSRTRSSGFALTGELAKAKDIKDVMSMQSRYAQTQMQSYALQARELGRLMTEAVQGMQSTA